MCSVSEQREEDGTQGVLAKSVSNPVGDLYQTDNITIRAQRIVEAPTEYRICA
jgi:hypothetical protein